MKPFLLLATRADDAVADAEYEAFRRFGGLTERELVRLRLESAPLTDLSGGPGLSGGLGRSGELGRSGGPGLSGGLDLREFSGIVIGGSPFTASDPAGEKSAVQVRVERELAGLVGDALKIDVPLLGACYGIGTLGLFLGGVVDRTFGEPVGAVEVELTAEGRADPLLDGVPDVFEAFVGHKEALREVPPGAVRLASSKSCPVQMFRVGRHQYATQFHPELDGPGIVERMHAYRHAGYFDPEELEELIERARAAAVTWPARILANFTARYASA